MMLWKRDTRNWTVRAIEGSPYPGTDTDGDTCCENTHFKSESDAWDSLEREAKVIDEINRRRQAQGNAPTR